MTKVVLCSPLQKIEGNKIRAKYVYFCGMCEFTFGATFMYCTQKNNNAISSNRSMMLIVKCTTQDNFTIAIPAKGTTFQELGQH